MSVANNHAMQYEDDAFHESAEALRAQGITPIGIADRDGKSNGYAYARGDVRIKCFAYSYRPDNHRKQGVLYATENRLALEQIRQARDEGNVVVVSLHWGDEYLHVPSKKQILLAHAMVDAGAGLIIGHHPHVLQGIERYKNGYIAYSLGNFIADFWQPHVRKTGLLRCSIGKDGVEDLEFVPLLINRDFQPTVPPAAEAARMRAEMEAYTKAIAAEAAALGTGEQPEYAQAAEKAYRKYRMQSYLYFLLNLWRYRPTIVVQSFARFTARRMGED
jgi:poly-gamma-glutamate synthesis protein (capsule biosynthesis protein)